MAACALFEVPEGVSEPVNKQPEMKRGDKDRRDILHQRQQTFRPHQGRGREREGERDRDGEREREGRETEMEMEREREMGK